MAAVDSAACQTRELDSNERRAEAEAAEAAATTEDGDDGDSAADEREDERPPARAVAAAAPAKTIDIEGTRFQGRERARYLFFFV